MPDTLPPACLPLYCHWHYDLGVACQMPDDDAVVSGEVVSDAYDGPGDWLPPADAARRLGVSERTLWRRVNAGQYQRRVTSGKAHILVPLAGSVPNEAGLVVPAAPDVVTLAVIEELRRQHEEAAERLTRQAERIAGLEREAGRLQAARNAEAARTADLAQRLAAAEWRWWHRFTRRA